MSEIKSQIYEFGDFRVDAAKRLLYGRENEPIALTPKVFDTLVYLVQNGQRVIEKDELMSKIWTDTIVEENNLNKNISILRRILGETKGEHRFIVTVPGRGYKFVAEVREITDVEKMPENISDNPELQSSNHEFQSEKKSHISNLKSETNDRRKSENEVQPPRENRRRKLLAAIAIAGVLLLAATGFYFWREGEKNSAAPIKSIAVLPFKPLVAENRNQALELGMADTLINKLGSSDEIIVRPLGSVRRFNGLEQNVLQAGRELAVDSVLEGTIQTSGDRIRISARLIRIGDGKQLWTQTYDENFTDIFAVQDSISNKVLSALTLTLSGERRQRLTKHDTENAEAYQFYMRGRFHAARLILPEAKKAVENYNEAIRLDPNYALAYVGIAQTYTGFSLSGDVPANEAMPKAKAAANKAIELDANLPESQVAAGLLAFWYDWNWSEAEKNYRRALELDANNAAAHFFYAHLNSNLGRHEKALTLVRRARELDPLSLIVNSAEGQFLFFAGKSDQAVSRLNETLELDPNFWHAHLVLSMIYSEKKQFAEAVREAQKAAQLSGENSQAVALKGYALAKSGDSQAARTVLAELQKSSAAGYVPAYNFAIIYNALGETEAALSFLEKAYVEKNVLTVFLEVDPKWNNLRSEPRFIALINKMNFEQ